MLSIKIFSWRYKSKRKQSSSWI